VTTETRPTALRRVAEIAEQAASGLYERGLPAAGDSLLANANRLHEMAFDLEFPKTTEVGHLPVPDGEWPGCDGRLRVYPSGNRVCDCGDAVIEP
jgi:hypothetical protein